MTNIPADPVRSRLVAPDRALALAVLVLAAAAWIAVALTHGASLNHQALGGLLPDAGSSHEHSGHEGHSSSQGAAAATLLVLGGWSLMVVAMMFPPALPLLQTLRSLVGQRRHNLALLVMAAGAFLAVWTVVGAMMIGGDAVLHATAERLPWAAQNPRLITGAVLAAAGLYQFTPLKRACLRACRSPRSFALAHWRGRRAPALELATVSAAYAVSCVGCCWALMAISLAVGAAALPAMVILAVVMAAERLVSWGRRLVAPVGVALISLGALTALGLLPTVTS